MKTEHVWIAATIALLGYSIYKRDPVFIPVNIAFLLFNLYQLRKNRPKREKKALSIPTPYGEEEVGKYGRY
jgi:lipid-A-disaccharide synthase-like uncharacterized protein